MTKNGSVHESEEELLSAEDAIMDAERLQILMQKKRGSEQQVHIQMSLHTLLEAIDHLEPEALREVMQRAEERLRRAA